MKQTYIASQEVHYYYLSYFFIYYLFFFLLIYKNQIYFIFNLNYFSFLFTFTWCKQNQGFPFSHTKTLLLHSLCPWKKSQILDRFSERPQMDLRYTTADKHYKPKRRQMELPA